MQPPMAPRLAPNGNNEGKKRGILTIGRKCADRHAAVEVYEYRPDREKTTTGREKRRPYREGKYDARGRGRATKNLKKSKFL